ncbi:RNA polymerase factor sigma-54 [Sporosalibacterium faouarense]|uniref:RNA polymerase factor sigma-54 n=1 Tax=Sporosalibacterium faouarense TaxID=516123 RepID=UPI001A9C8AD9|nr:RNA polymerase factor sigma-54 [Sporosalibacterium faouarense]
MEMNFNMNMQQQQKQKLIMTTEMRQALKILQLNSNELNALIQEELMNNPVLEINSRNDDIKDSRKEEELSSWKKSLLEGSYQKSYNSHGKEWQDEDKKDFNNYISITQTLKEHLLFQLNMQNLSELEKDIAEYVIENIDENGYLNYGNPEIVEKFGVSIDEINKIVDIIQSFDPVGVGARDLKECLLIQLKEKEYENPVVLNIVNNYLADLKNNKLNYIATKLNVSVKVVQNSLDIIRTLEPKPGRLFSNSKDTQYINPDINIIKRDGEYIVIMNDISAPRLNISRYYKALNSKEDLDEETKTYINNKINSAIRLISNIEQRRNTIYSIVTEILKYQSGFFEKGKLYLKPMTLKDIALVLDINESTVSRAINDKYAETPMGTFALRFFFQGGKTKRAGEEISTQSIKLILKDIIAKENPTKPLSDQDLSNMFKNRGIDISRRTIAKYRNELNIPSSTQRRRYE